MHQWRWIGLVALMLWGPALWAQGSYFRTAEGKWEQLKTATEGGGLRFSLSPEAIGGSQTLLIISKPEWMVLEDDEAPLVEKVLLDGEEHPAEALELGRVTRAPAELAMAIRDSKNPLDMDQLVVRINGKKVPAAQLQVVRLDKEGLYYRVAVKLGDLPPANYALTVRVPDRSPAANDLTVKLSFDSAPILANGDFEQVDKDNKPIHWTCTAWSSGADTVYEMDVREGGLDGGKALRIKGISGSLNLVCFQQPVPLAADKAYVFTGHYKASKAAGLSIITRKTEVELQYLSHSLPAADEWTPFSFEFTPEDHDSIMLLLRSNGEGEVWFDQVKVELLPQ
jgi:hypothetical protein